MNEAINSNPTAKPASAMKLYPRTIQEGDIKKISGLLERGADVNSIDEDGKTALWWAAFKGNVALVRLLLEKNADKNIRDNVRKLTPLEIATELALRGYREPNEENLHATIINLLNPSVVSTPSTPAQSSHQDDDSLATQMSRLGIHASASSSAQKSPAPMTFVKPDASQKHEEERTCTLL